MVNKGCLNEKSNFDAGTVAVLSACYQVTEEDRRGNILTREAGTVINAESGQEVSYDMKSGNDCFALSYEENFDYASVEELLSACFPGIEETVWTAQTTWNNHRDGVSVEDGALGLWVKRVDDENHPVVKEDRRIAKSLCGGLTYNRKVLYGCIEARLRMFEKKSSQYWHGFYTYVLQKDESGKSVGGYEFDIFEPLDIKDINQTTHWPFSDSIRTTYQYAAPIEFDRWYTVSVVWTPEKVAYYLDDELSYVLYNDNRNGFLPASQVRRIRNGGSIASDNHKYQIVANLPQDIILVAAAGDASASWTGMSLMPVERREDGWSQKCTNTIHSDITNIFRPKAEIERRNVKIS